MNSLHVIRALRSDAATPRSAECPSDAAFVELFEGRLPGPPAERLRAHIASCSGCREMFEALTSAATIESGEAVRGGAFAEAIGEALGRGASIGRYVVLSLIGRGGMGEVYAAYDPELDRRIALKLLHTARGTAGARARLVREARALGKLSHPNVVQVHDVGEHEGDVFVAMELVDGEPLDAWCKGAPRPPWRAVLDAYLDAARGLSAAHDKGLVHRDVKPGNLLRGKDGRVRVADFGLAAAAREDDLRDEVLGGRDGKSGPAGAAQLAETVPVPEVSGERLTATGALVGTPLYMAPEQHEGASVGPAADQYSLCAALYEGLHGALPFAPAPGADPPTLPELADRKRAGAPAAPPAGSPVPAWIHKAVARGLAPRAEDRYPSLAALIAALGDDPDARRRARWRGAAIGAAAAALLAVGAAGWAKSGAFVDPCAHPERQLAGVWDGGVEGRMRASFAGTGRPYAADTADRVASILDRYAGAWAAMRGEVCEAGRSGKQRRELIARRDECLDRRLGELGALTAILAGAHDAQTVDRAVRAAGGLAPVSFCADVQALSARVLPPEDPALRGRAADLNARIDRINALDKVGSYAEGLALAEPLLAEAAAIDYPWVRARAQFATGNLRLGKGDLDGAKALLREAAVSAQQAGDHALTATAWTRLLYVVAERQQRFDEAVVIRSFGPAFVPADDARAQAFWADAEGQALLREGIAHIKMDKIEEAKARFEHALALLDATAGPDSLDSARIYNNLGNALSDIDDVPGSRAVYEHGLSILEKALGPDHVEVAPLASNLGNLLRVLGDFPAALARDRQAGAIWERSGDPNVAYAVHNEGTVLHDMGDFAGARERFERALPLFEKQFGPSHPNVAAALMGLGRALARLGRHDEARAAIDRARAMIDKDDPQPLVALAELALARDKPGEAVPLLERALDGVGGVIEIEIQLTLADALWRSGKDFKRARELAETARAGYEKIGHRPGADRAARWLSDHPLPAR
jgi:serine/threonine-protein kinase